MTSNVIGNGPIGFTDTNGNQRFIPLSVLYFKDGQIQVISTVKNESPYKENQGIIEAILKNLVDGGFLTPGVSPPPKPALILEAARPGAVGNTIQVTFSNIVVDSNTPANTTFDATITAKQTYSELSFDVNSSSFIKKVLGTEDSVGSSPGLVYVKNTNPSTPPTNNPSYNLEGGEEGTKSSVDIKVTSSDSTAFTLEAWQEGSEGNNITITISQVEESTKTFTLVVEFKPLLIEGIKLTDLPSKLQGSSFVITVSEPVDGVYAVPAPGTIILGGGADAKAASTAKAIALAKL